MFNSFIKFLIGCWVIYISCIIFLIVTGLFLNYPWLLIVFGVIVIILIAVCILNHIKTVKKYKESLQKLSDNGVKIPQETNKITKSDIIFLVLIFSAIAELTITILCVILNACKVTSINSIIATCFGLTSILTFCVCGFISKLLARKDKNDK